MTSLEYKRNFIKKHQKADWKVETSPMDEYDIKRLADQFGVSKQSMLIRLLDELHILCRKGELYYKGEEAMLELGGQQTLF